MTSKQESEFNSYGCASRCLIALANSSGKNISLEQFIDQYTPKYWASSNQCGALTFTQIIEIANDLGLASDIKLTSDISAVRTLVKQKAVTAILVYTKKKYELDGTLSDYHHCSIVSPSALVDDALILAHDFNDDLTFTKGISIAESCLSTLEPTFICMKD